MAHSKLAFVIDELCKEVEKSEKTAAVAAIEDLSDISSDVVQTLLKLANEIKNNPQEITYNDIDKFVNNDDR